jgi:hypothetical protein
MRKGHPTGLVLLPDRIVLFSGNGDFRSLLEAVQRRGARVTVVSTISSQPPMTGGRLHPPHRIAIEDRSRSLRASAPALYD